MSEKVWGERVRLLAARGLEVKLATAPTLPDDLTRAAVLETSCQGDACLSRIVRR